MTQKRRVLCRLCGHEGDSTQPRAWYEAVDHLLDHHRDKVLSHPKKLRAMISIALPVAKKTAAEAFRKTGE